MERVHKQRKIDFDLRTVTMHIWRLRWRKEIDVLMRQCGVRWRRRSNVPAMRHSTQVNNVMTGNNDHRFQHTTESDEWWGLILSEWITREHRTTMVTRVQREEKEWKRRKGLHSNICPFSIMKKKKKKTREGLTYQY